jgi:hypothetical protein
MQTITILPFKFTSEIINEYAEKLKKRVNTHNIKLRLEDEIRIQKENEKNLLEKYKSLLNNNVLNIAENLSNINFDKLKEEMKDEYKDENLMKVSSAIFEAIFYKYNDINDKLIQKFDKLYLSKPLSPNERGREYIKDLKRIGKESVYGIVMTETLKNNQSKAEDLFIIKTSSIPKYNDDIIHECIVGFYGTNKLRDVGIPNFAYVVGAFSGSPTFYNDEKIISFIDTMKNPVNYIIYENINPSIPLSEYCTKCSAEDFLLYYCQIIYALLYAYKKIGFTHYDAHADNILMREISNKPFYIAYPDLEDKNKKCYLYSKGYIPTFIDYGMSHITIDKENFGSVDNLITSGYSIFRDRPFFFYDAYKILMSSLRYMKNYNVKEYNKVNSLLYFFTDVNDGKFFLSFIEKQNSFDLPYTQATSGLNEEQWKEFSKEYGMSPNFDETKYILPTNYFYSLIKYYNDNFKSTTIIYTEVEKDIKGDILSCNKSNISIQKNLEKLNVLSTNNVVCTFEEFYDVYGLLYGQLNKSQSEMENLIDNYESVEILNLLYEAMKKHRRLNKDVEKYEKRYNDYKIDPSLKTEYLKLRSQIENINSKIIEFISSFIPKIPNALKEEKEKFDKIIIELDKGIIIKNLPSDIDSLLDFSTLVIAKKSFYDAVQYLTTYNSMSSTLWILYYIFKIYKNFNKNSENIFSIGSMYEKNRERFEKIRELHIKSLYESINSNIEIIKSPELEKFIYLKIKNAKTELVKTHYKRFKWYINTYPTIESLMV